MPHLYRAQARGWICWDVIADDDADALAEARDTAEDMDLPDLGFPVGDGHLTANVHWPIDVEVEDEGELEE